jgi:hypothetical protein
LIERPLTVTVFTNQYAKTKTEVALPLKKIGAMIGDCQAKAKEDLPWLKLAAFGDLRTEKGCLRNNANYLMGDGVEIDVDGTLSFEAGKAMLADAGLVALIYTTPSHTDEKPHWRALLPTAVSFAPEWREELCARANGLLQGAADGASFTLSQCFYYGAVDGRTPVRVEILDGLRGIDQADDLDAKALGRDGRPYGSPRVRVQRIPRDSPDPPQIDDDDDPLRPEPNWPLIESALAVFTYEDRKHYQPWCKFGIALHSTGSPRAFDIWDKWSQGKDDDPNFIWYDRAECVEKWKTFGTPLDGEYVGIGTIFYEASLRGWIDPRKKPVFEPDDITVAAWLERDIPAADHLLGELFSTTSRGLLIGPTGLGNR